MILLLDNYDSFTYNLEHYLEVAGARCITLRNDDPKLSQLNSSAIEGIVISPGPGRPAGAGALMQVLEAYVSKIPVLGICLGHQAIGEYFGAVLAKAARPMHGKISGIHHTSHPLFANIQQGNKVVRYHSLVLKSVPDVLETIAETDDENREIMAIAHKQLPVWGIQFHPEAELTENGMRLISNWLQYHRLV